MKILALGGPGDTGQHAVRAAYEFDSIRQIVVGDRDGQKAAAFAGQFDAKVTATQLDVTDRAALVHELTQCDIVISTIGPYYQYGTLVLSAALEAHCHYLDICDDWEPTLDMLALHEDAITAGITAIVGAGASPGISNLLAVKAYGALDQVHTLHTVWGAGDPDKDQSEGDDEDVSQAVLEHWIQQLTGTIRLLRDGQHTERRPLEEITVNYPGIGAVVCYTVGHPEPVTLPRSLSGLRHSFNLMHMPAFVISFLQTVGAKVDSGQLSIPAAAKELIQTLAPKEDHSTLAATMRYLAHGLGKVMTRKKYLPELAAVATGEQDGRKAVVGASLDGNFSGGIGPLTCIPTALIAEMISRREITKPGVFAPEDGIDPDLFFQRLAPYAVRYAPHQNRPFVHIATSH